MKKRLRITRKDGVKQRYWVGKKPRISKSDRIVFSSMSNPKIVNKEYGGNLDFNKKGQLEKFHVSPGKKNYVDIDMDYELGFHTHNLDDDSPPSSDDMVAFLKSKAQQAHIIFRKGRAFIIYKNPESSKYSKMSSKKLYSIFNDLLKKTEKFKNWEDRYIIELRKLGLKASINKKVNTPISLNIKPYEPRGGRQNGIR